jgi:hypothetical protein
MFRVIQVPFFGFLLFFTPFILGCDDSPRVVKETSDQTFEDVAARIAAESDEGEE